MPNMASMRPILTATLITALLTACGPPRAPTLADRLGSLPAPPSDAKETPIPGESAAPASAGEDPQSSIAALETAIVNYRAYLRSAPRHDPNRLRVQRRVADLLIELNQARLTAGQRQHDQDLHEAIAIYREVFRETDGREDKARILYQLARAYVDTGQTDMALQTWRRLAREFPDAKLTAETDFRRAEMLFDRGEFERAADAYGQALERLEPNSPMALQAGYKRGWSLLRMGRLQTSVAQQLALLDRALPSSIRGLEDLAALSGGEHKRIEDILDALARAWAQIPAADPIGEALGGRARADELLLYESYAAFLLDKERFTDAAEVYAAYARRNPDHPKAPLLAARVVETFEQAGFDIKAREARIDFVDRYAPDGGYWRRTGRTPTPRIAQTVRTQLLKLAQDYHALSQRGDPQAEDAARQAIRWYRRFLTAYDSDEERYRINFLLGELLYEQRRFAEAAEAYERTAYHLPTSAKGEEAAYAALQSWEGLLGDATGEVEHGRIRRQIVNSSRQLARAYPNHRHLGEVLVRAAQISLLIDEPAGARDLASMGLSQASLTTEQTKNAWIARADGALAMADHAAAERAYGQALQATSRDRDPALYQKLIERRAAAVYKQGESALADNRPVEAAEHFRRVAKVGAGAMDIIPVSRYDAAAAYISAGRPDEAITLLENLRGEFPKHRLADDADRRLVKLYEESGQPAKAAAALERLYTDAAADDQREADWLWTAAGLYQKAGEDRAAIKALEGYLADGGIAFDAAIEARFRLVALHQRIGDERGADRWRERLVDTERRGGARRTDRTRLLAARASIALAEAKREEYERIRLSRPLQRSLKAKKQRMESALAAYEAVAGYGIAETTTRATYQMAALYQDFAKALLDSEPPSDLSAEALAEYRIMLEDQAFAFEDKAIELHSINAKRTAEGIYNEWVVRSFEQLAKMFPARYAKHEEHAIIEQPI